MIRIASFLSAALLLALAAACNQTGSSRPEEAAGPAATATAELPGQALYAQNCALCHGPDGKKGLNGAHDLTKSNLNATGRVYMVTQGLGQMPSFKGQLTEAQIQQVVEYSLTLK